ncbi:hypothetical protein Patl1_10711 [Pistacia atlantica]|uniref:Uncharacterized protein n=1 Tax=Pistacia atlantica TaxID=434234 RepID=A0ACC1A0R2_9ROSI|nr:hypothetical protein Patl1_10711 [Pistacia atlantica]
MGEQSHISMDFDNIISVTLENYLDLQMKPEDGKEARQHSQSQDQWVQGVLKEESHGSSFPDMSKRVSSLWNPVSNPKLYLIQHVKCWCTRGVGRSTRGSIVLKEATKV